MITILNIPIGNDNNILAGFLPQNITFKREDIAIVGTSAGANNNLLITVNADLRPYINVGEYVYVYSEATTFNYDVSAQIISIAYISSQTLITINTLYIESGTGGYLNYFQNWFVEAQIVSTANTDYSIYPFTLKSGSSPAGIAEIDVSVVNDLNELAYVVIAGGEIDNSRKKFKVKYRQGWRESQNQSYTLIASPANGEFIVQYSTADIDNNKIVNDFENPLFFVGYNTSVVLAHSDNNFANLQVSAYYDELDSNENEIVSNQFIRSFDTFNFGYLAASSGDLAPGTTFDINTKKIKVKFVSQSIADYSDTDYNSNDYKTV